MAYSIVTPNLYVYTGATGAFEDTLMSGENSIGPYDLMFNIQLGSLPHIQSYTDIYIYILYIYTIYILVYIIQYTRCTYCICIIRQRFFIHYDTHIHIGLSYIYIIYHIFIHLYISGKSVISFCALIIANGVNEFVKTINQGGLSLLLLGLTGAIGQVEGVCIVYMYRDKYTCMYYA